GLFFPMYLHPGWGRGDTRITGLKLMVGGREAVGAHVAVNYVRATYDVRMATTNAALINAAARFYLWNGDTAFLARMMPRLRRAILFLQEHLGGRSHGLICQDWFVGHDGLGGDRPGHGMIGSYWDLLPSGRYDIESSIAYWLALRNMAALEDACRVKRMSVAAQSVLGPDGRTRIAYAESAATLRRHSERVKRAIEHTFWMPDTGRFCRNVDAYGRNHDYGFLHLNVQAVAWGIATDEQRRSVLSWLDGRPVPGDTSIGSDIYRWRFAPRSSTRRNTDYYFWPWIWDWRNEPGSAYRVYGDQMQDGGAIPATALWEAMARCSTGDQAQVDRAFERSRETQRWFEDVTAAGGDGAAFYRAYYHNRPDRGKQQSPMPGGIGLDREFLSDSSLGTLVPLYAFLGLDAHEDGVLTVAPCLPTGLTSLRVDNVLYRGRLLHIEASPSRVTIAGARSADGLKVRVQFRTAGRRATVTVNGSPVPSRLAGGRTTVTAALNAESVTIRVADGQPNNREPQMSR
ncbi:MAG: hypothetical protein FJX72_21455, partial [Armatimonadetes bacterium]|nr:hypothetical protein [Armatimonadota bacterium]